MMMRTGHAMGVLCGVFMLTGGVAVPARAQVTNASPMALGMGENHTAAARGWSAVSWNPAGLGLSGNRAFTFTMGAVGGIAGLGPITMSDLKAWEDQLIPAEVKEEWLARIRSEGGQSGTGGVDGTWLGMQLGLFAVQFSTTARAVNDVSPGIAELLLFGNADANGDPRTIDLSGSSLKMAAWSSGAASIGAPVAQVGGGWLALGATAKYTVGHVLAFARESIGSTSADPIGVTLTFPMLHTFVGDDEEAMRVDNGSGFGLDVGAGWERGRLTLAASAQNVVSTFAWDEASLRYRPARMTLTMTSREAAFEERPYAEAPAQARDAVAGMTFHPSYAAGAMLRHSPALTLTADARHGSGIGLAARPTTHVGAGAELRALSWLPLRAGAAVVQAGENNGGVQFGGGFAIELGTFNIAASAVRRSLELGGETVFLATLLSRGR